ncbi:MAG: ASCH domain-containing protein [Clostridia bacterium]
MKVLSLTEPWATLIKDKKKFIETRSWQTNYRGELFIHASLTKIPKYALENTELMSIVGDSKMNYGYIICKCKLVDCVYMDEDFLKQIKLNRQEHTCGEYEIGRYAWILEDIEVLKEQIKAKGSLGIWNYYNELDIMDIMSEINYGWMDKNFVLHSEVDNLFSDNYILQTPSDVIKNKMGVCWDQVELERYYFKNNDWDIKTYFIVHYDGDKCPTHTFLTFKKNGKYYWFEHSWKKYRGIYSYDSINNLLFDVRDKFIKYELNENYTKQNLFVREYKKPNYHISVQDFYSHCETEKYIDLGIL